MTLTEQDYEYTFGTNMKSVLNVSQVIARRMVECKHGCAIVNISSVSSRHGENRPVYCASKRALDQITRCMAVELGPHQIRVNSVNPTAVEDTHMYETAKPPGTPVPPHLEQLMDRTPLKRFCKMENIINATLYLLSDKADMINGAILPVDGGVLCA